MSSKKSINLSLMQAVMSFLSLKEMSELPWEQINFEMDYKPDQIVSLRIRRDTISDEEFTAKISRRQRSETIDALVGSEPGAGY